MNQHVSLPLLGRTAVITGVSRRKGIGFAIASRLARMGANLFVHHWVPHDENQPWGADSIDELTSDLRRMLAEGARLDHAGIDLAAAAGAERLIRTAAAARRPCRRPCHLDDIRPSGGTHVV